MKLLKRVFVIFALIIGLVLIVAAFLPSKVDISREAVIKAPIGTVYNNVLDYTHYRQWNPWGKSDTDAVHTIDGQTGVVGCNWSWVGDTLGTGGMTLVEFNKPHKIVNRLVFTAPQAMAGDDIWTFEQKDDGVKVVWTTSNELSWPMNRIVGLFLDKMIGASMEQGLIYLEEYSRKTQKVRLETIHLDVKGMTCKGCENTVVKTVAGLSGVKDVTASHKKEEVCVTYVVGAVELDKIQSSIAAVGYEVKGEKVPKVQMEKQRVKKTDM